MPEASLSISHSSQDSAKSFFTYSFRDEDPAVTVLKDKPRSCLAGRRTVCRISNRLEVYLHESIVRQGSGSPNREIMLIMFRGQVMSGTFSLPDAVLPVVKLTFIDPVSLAPGTFTHTAGIGFGQDLFPFSKTEVFCFL
jgi:hypothetical protein